MNTPKTNPIADQIERIKAEIAKAPQKVKLVAVSKFQQVGLVKQAYDAGQRAFGENYVKEALLKMPLLPDDCDWHLIGPLQKNKIKLSVGRFTTFHALSDFATAELLEKWASERKKSIQVLIQMNLDQENTKNGLTLEDELWVLAEKLESLQQVTLIGLMTMPSPHLNTQHTAEIYARLRGLRDSLAKRYSHIRELSMGMTQDYPIAVAEGATIVRIGSAIFGERPQELFK